MSGTGEYSAGISCVTILSPFFKTHTLLTKRGTSVASYFLESIIFLIIINYFL